MLGLAVANRVVACLDTYLTVKSRNKKLAMQSSDGQYHMAMNPQPFGPNPGVSFSITRTF